MVARAPLRLRATICRQAVRRRLLLVALLVLVAAPRFWLAATTPGTTDIKRLVFWSKLEEKRQYRRIYSTYRPLWNHPAPSLMLIRATRGLARASGMPFGVTFRFVTTLFDLGSVALLYHYGRARAGSPGGGLLAASCYALSPIAIIVSGYHGNTDSIMTFLALAGVLAFPRSSLTGALLVGLALCVKYPAALVLVVLLIGFPGGFTSTARLAMAALAPFLLVTIAVVHPFAKLAFHNIADYSSEPGTWGLGHLTVLMERASDSPLFHPVQTVLASLLQHGRLVIVLLVSAVALTNRYRRALDPIELVALAWGIFFVFAPGFATQYLVWILPFFILCAPYLAIAYTISGGVFLCVAYATGARDPSGMVVPDMHLRFSALVAWGTCVLLMGLLVKKLVSPRSGVPKTPQAA